MVSIVCSMQCCGGLAVGVCRHLPTGMCAALVWLPGSQPLVYLGFPGKKLPVCPCEVTSPSGTAVGTEASVE